MTYFASGLTVQRAATGWEKVLDTMQSNLFLRKAADFPRDSERFFHLVVVALVIFFIDQKDLLEEALLFDLLREPAGG